MKAYIVNLVRSPERRAHMVQELNKVELDHEFVEGVDGRGLDLSDARLVDQSWLPEGAFWAGVVGCSLSHLKIYEMVLQGSDECVLVLEDDVVVPGDLVELIDALSEEMVGAEAVLLHHHRSGRAERDEVYRFLKRGSVELHGSRTLAAPADIADVAGTGAYLITREACARLVGSMSPVRARADDWQLFCDEGALERVRCVVPIPVAADTRFRTTIDLDASRSLRARLRDRLNAVPVLSHALTVRRQRLMARRTQVAMIDDA